MPIRNRPLKRCLLLSINSSVVSDLKILLWEEGYLLDVSSNRKSALSLFLQYRHNVFIIDAEFLPRYPYRLMQLFKMAHRTPGVLILNETGKDLTGFTCLPEGVIEVVEGAFEREKVLKALNQIDGRVAARTRKLFLRDIAVLVGLALPILFFLLVFLKG